MKRINIDKWKAFRVGDLFDIHPTQSYNLTNHQLMDSAGTIPVLANSSYNNGIGGYSSKPPTEKGNIVTFSDTVDANTIFYQKNDFIGYSHVQGLYPIGEYKLQWNEYSYLFFVSVFRKAALTKGFNYGNKFRRDIAVDLFVFLPVLNNDKLDFKSMESYMLQLLNRSKNNLNSLFCHTITNNAICLGKWNKFHLYDDGLFNIDMGTKLDKVKMSQLRPEINFVGRANANNGITCRVDRISDIQPYEPGNLTLSLGGEYLGSCFIQPDFFYTSQNVIVLKPKWNMPFTVKQFIATMIFKESRTYYKAFIDELNRHIKTDFSFYLPTTGTGVPNWEYMDEYMRGILDKSSKHIDILSKVLY